MGRILCYEEKENNDWLNSEVHDLGYQILNDEKECSENNPDPSHNKAFECLETAMKWLKRQKNIDPIQLMYLRRIRGMAALKRMSLLK